MRRVVRLRMSIIVIVIVSIKEGRISRVVVVKEVKGEKGGVSMS
jgi:hypothetical protein